MKMCQNNTANEHKPMSILVLLEGPLFDSGSVLRFIFPLSVIQDKVMREERETIRDYLQHKSYNNLSCTYIHTPIVHSL